MRSAGLGARLRFAGDWLLRWRHPLWWLPDVPSEQDESYRRIWASLRQMNHVLDGRHDTVNFSRRQGDLVVIGLRIPADCFDEDMAQLTDALQTLDYVRLVPPEHWRITIQELGYLNESPNGRDEITLRWLDEYLEQCALSLRDFRPFDVRLGGANSFADAAILDVHDDGWLSRVHDVLVDFVSQPPRTRYPYLPEFVIAEYTSRASIGNLVHLLTPYRDTTFATFRASSIDVLRIPTTAAYAQPTLVRSYPLGTLTGFMDRVSTADALTG